MAINLQKSQRIDLRKNNGSALNNICVGVNWGAIETRNWLGVKKIEAVDLDASCILYDANKKAIDIVYFGHLMSNDGAIKHSGFSIFVMLQFWNMFNAKAYHTGRTTFMNLQKSLNFLIIAMVIVLGQVLITSFGGKMFNVVPLKVTDWIIITLTTSIVLWIGEFTRSISKN